MQGHAVCIFSWQVQSGERRARAQKPRSLTWRSARHTPSTLLAIVYCFLPVAAESVVCHCFVELPTIRQQKAGDVCWRDFAPAVGLERAGLFFVSICFLVEPFKISKRRTSSNRLGLLFPSKPPTPLLHFLPFGEPLARLVEKWHGSLSCQASKNKGNTLGLVLSTAGSRIQRTQSRAPGVITGAMHATCIPSHMLK